MGKSCGAAWQRVDRFSYPCFEILSLRVDFIMVVELSWFQVEDVENPHSAALDCFNHQLNLQLRSGHRRAD